MTTNLQLEEIELNDNIKTTFIRKLNDNQAKIDSAYGYLKDNLIQATGEHDLASAVEDYKNDFANIIQPLQEEIAEKEQTITEKQNTINTLNSIGNATTSDIVNGKTALVQGQTITGTAFGTTTTASANDIMNGKTAYSNNGTLLTGTYVPPTTQEKTTSGHIGGQSATFTFDEDITNKRIIFFAKPEGTYLRCTSSVQYLVFADSGTNTFGALYHSSSSNTVSYLYDRGANYTITKNGNSATISGSSSSYMVGGYSSTYTAELHCLAI